MQVIKFLLFILVFILSSTVGTSQDKVKSFNFKKGEVIDFLFISTKTDDKAKETSDRYFATAFPIARKEGYAPQPGFSTPSTPTQGNYHPEVVALGKWPSIKGRLKALNDLETQLEDFHEMRRTIWSNFDVTYYELMEDLNFEVAPEKHTVITLYWAKEKGFDSFKSKWMQQMKSANGKVLVDLGKGFSTYGYHFVPDMISITEWNSKEDFEKFNKLNMTMDHSSVLHVNQMQIK